jgi:hypothetical protein
MTNTPQLSALLTCLSLIGSHVHAASAPPTINTPPMAIITQAAQSAQQRCYSFMHEDADEYTLCIDAITQEVKGDSAKAQQQRLGIQYFGWVGANNSARIGLPGADASAAGFLVRFRSLQHTLGIADESLCRSVAGECKSRLAQIHASEAAIKRAAAIAVKANQTAKTTKTANKQNRKIHSAAAKKGPETTE